MKYLSRRQVSASLAACALAARASEGTAAPGAAEVAPAHGPSQAPAPTGAVAAPATIRRSGIQEVVVSVFDIDQFARGFVEAAEFRKVALPDAAPEQFAAWRVPAGCSRIEQAHLVHPNSPELRGGMRLAEFSSTLHDYWRRWHDRSILRG